MWDFSWLMCGHPGGAFYDLARRVEEAADRGYNTLRVDVFPNLYTRGEHTFEGAKQPPLIHSWGTITDPSGYTVNVREKVIELAELCRKYNIWLGLDTWQSWTMVPEKLVPIGKEEEASRRIANHWVEAIPRMRDDGVLERAVWVAPLNEVPLFLGSKLEKVKVSDTETRHEGMVDWKSDLPELDATFHDINHWLGEAVKEAIKEDGIPLSYSSLGAENYNARVPDYYDLVDVHFMPDIVLTDEDRHALEKAGQGASKFNLHHQQGAFDLALFSGAWTRACRRNYDRMLSLCHRYAANATARLELPSGKRLEAVVTEAYGPCNFPDHEDVDWSWYYKYNADAARIFAQYPFSGLTISNHAEPIFCMWEQGELQRRINSFILSNIHGKGKPGQVS